MSSRTKLAVVGVCALVSCTTTQPPAQVGAKPEPALSASAVPASPPRPAALYDAQAWQESWPKAWTDPRVVAALAKKCDFLPDERPPGGGDVTPADLFRCTPMWSQSCNPDPCYGLGDVCERRCVRGCVDCGADCSKSCESCKSACSDEACIHACAQKCAECKDGCGAKGDKCTSATCGRAHAECGAKVKKAWKTNACPARCGRYFSCKGACDTAKDPAVCADACAAALAPGWKACGAKCEALRTDGKSEEASACLADCYMKVPCAPFLCDSYGTMPNP